MTEKLQEAVSNRIRGLLAKTVENGATEAEAMSSAAKARELMDRYRLSMTDVEIQAEPIITETVERANDLRMAPADYCLHGIDAYCGVKTWYSKSFGHRLLKILGLKADVEMARYLYEMIAGAIKVETALFQKTKSWLWSDNRRTATSSFQVGMATRIENRLQEMARALEPSAKTASGTALVIVKNAIVDQAFAEVSAGLKRSRLSGGMVDGSSLAYGAGRAAGNRVNLSRPVSGGNTKRLS